MFDITLRNGRKMNALGFGTYKITGDFDATECVLKALEVGYRRIDTAVLYQNEAEIGVAVDSCGLPRKELFLTTKLWTDVDSEDKVLRSVESSLKKLKTDYVDLLLIHWPMPKNVTVWRAMERLYGEGVLKAIGVSNFKEHHIEEIKEKCDILPMVNQVELHPLFQQPALRRYCGENGIVVEAWSPLMRGKALLLPELKKIADERGRSVSQIVLRFDLQSGLAVIPKSTKSERIAENFDVFDFSLSEREMKIIAGLNRDERQYRDPDNHGY